MKVESLKTVVSALNKAEVRYLIAGGLAVVAHGYSRLTMDLDLVFAMDSENLLRALKVFDDLGYIPRAPVPILDFSDAQKRETWIREKGMTVFSLMSSCYPDLEVDCFAELPFNFEDEYAQALSAEIYPSVSANFVSKNTLIDMKKRANRDKDLADIQVLKQL